MSAEPLNSAELSGSPELGLFSRPGDVRSLVGRWCQFGCPIDSRGICACPEGILQSARIIVSKSMGLGGVFSRTD